MSLKIIIVGGARPNFMKIAPIYREFKKRNHPKIEYKLLHTGQHYDYKMSSVFFEQFELPKPDYFLNVGSGSHAEQTAKIMIEFEKVANEFNPDILIVVGDVNSTIACSLVAAKLGIKIIHVEAGLRSFDNEMPEEINRILTDRITDLLLCSEPSGVDNLNAENVPHDKIELVGNTMIDTLMYHMNQIDDAKTYVKHNLQKQEYAVATAHRPSNVDKEISLKNIIEIFKYLTQNLKLVIPLHPRTRKNLEKFNLLEEFKSISNLILLEPLGYFEFMNLVKNSKMILTDSGGIQEETTVLGVPCITLRENTERPYTLDIGTNVITGVNQDKIKAAFESAMKFDDSNYRPPKLWDGRAAGRIFDKITEKYM